MRTFEEAWAEKGYQYGREPLQNVRLGWEMALAEASREVEYLKKAVLTHIEERDQARRDLGKMYRAAARREISAEISRLHASLMNVREWATADALERELEKATAKLAAFDAEERDEAERG